MAFSSIGGISQSFAGAAMRFGAQGTSGNGGTDPFVSDLASKLGVSTTALQKAMDAARQQLSSSSGNASGSSSSSSGSGTSGPGSSSSSAADPMSGAIASQLGISATTVQNAVNQLRSAHSGHGHHHHGGGSSSDSSQTLYSVASSLGVSSSDLQDAMAKAIEDSVNGTSSTSSTSSTGSSSSTSSSSNDASALLQDVANRLGVDSSKLISAFKSASSSVVNSYA